jgi:methionine-gamma-lyase
MNEEHDYRATRIGAHRLHPETLMLGYGYDPHLSEGAVKPPVFLTSTFIFPNAEAGREFFDIAAGRKPGKNDVEGGLVYARFNHPNAQILEDRLAVMEGADTAAVFASGMAAIATTVLAHARPGDVILHSRPLYGGTEGLFHRVLPNFGITAQVLSDPNAPEKMRADVAAAAAAGRVAAIFLETPSNPLATMADIALAAECADEIAKRQGYRPLVLVDNTLLGPVFQKPLACGADLSLYSLTKFVGGHSDLIAGAVVGRRAALTPVRQLRALLGGHLDPHSCWMLGRSLETLVLRMTRAADNAEKVAHWLARHRAVKAVHYPGLYAQGSRERALYERQCQGAGSMFSFDVGDRARAFAVLDRLKVVKLAVSLGGTESLTCHPATTVHSNMTPEERGAMGVTEGLIRLSVGIEHPDDLIADLDQALAAV